MNLIEARMDARALVTKLEAVAGAKGPKRLVYAVVNAINSTAKLIQAAEVEHVRDVFTVRKAQFMLGSPSRPGGAAARIKPFASVKDARPYAEISVGAGSQASNRRLLLSQFEEGGIRKPFTPGAKAVAVPITGRPARPSSGRGVPPEYTFAGLKLTAFHKGKRLTRTRRNGEGRAARTVGVGLLKEFGRVSLPSGEQGSIQWKGRNRTFLLTKAKGSPFGGVFQRIGPDRGDIREIYEFRKDDPIDKRLEFVATARRVADVWFPRYMEQEIDDVFKRAGFTS